MVDVTEHDHMRHSNVLLVLRACQLLSCEVVVKT